MAELCNQLLCPETVSFSDIVPKQREKKHTHVIKRIDSNNYVTELFPTDFCNKLLISLEVDYLRESNKRLSVYLCQQNESVFRGHTF
jgi:hypothetical protein